MNSINRNIHILDSLRAFAALSVCLYHFVCTTTDYISTNWILNIFEVGKYGVQLFFVISGFVIPWAMFHAGFRFRNFFSFLAKRLARLEPPYLFSILIALLILFCKTKIQSYNNSDLEISFTQIILHFGYLIPFSEGYKWLNPVYWTLAIEFQYYFFIALLFIPLINCNQITRVLIYIAIVVLSFVSNSVFLFYWLPVFLIGILLFLIKARLISSNEYYLISGLLFLFCLYRYPFISVCYMILPAIGILYFSAVKSNILDFLGKMSYSIYLMHSLVGASFINILSHSIHNPVGKILVILGGIVLTLISSYLMYLWIEKPSKKLSASVKYK